MARLVSIGTRTIKAITMPIHMIPSVEPGTDASASVGVGVISSERGASGGSGRVPLARPEMDVTSANNKAKTRTDMMRIVDVDFLRTRAVYHGVIPAHLTFMV